jgi:hypothetical protein
LKIPDIVKVSLDVLQKRAMPKEKGGEQFEALLKPSKIFYKSSNPIGMQRKNQK